MFCKKGSGFAQLVEWLLPTPEIRGLNPVIGNTIYYQLYLKDENKEKRGQL